MKFELEDIGRHERLTLELPIGFSLLAGRGGAGKSTASVAIRAATGDPGARPEVRDGASRGSISVDGVQRLKVTGSRRTRAKGEDALVVDLAFDDSMGPFEALVQPRETTTDGRFHAWVTALADLAGLEIGAQEADALAAGEDVIAETILGLPPDKAAAEARRAWHEIKRLKEEHAKRERARADAEAILADRAAAAFEDAEAGALEMYRRATGSTDRARWDAIDEDALADLKRIAAESSKRHTVIAAKAEQREAAERRRKELEAQHGEMPSIEYADSRLRLARAASEEAQQLAAKHRQEAEDLRARLAAAEEIAKASEVERGRKYMDVGDANHALEKERRRLADWQSAAIELARPIEGPTFDDAIEAAKAERIAKATAECAEAALHARTAAENATAAEKSAGIRETAARDAEKTALGTWSRLGALIGDRCEGVKIDGEPARLEGQVSGTWLDWEARMSPNQRARIVLPLLARIPERRLVEVPQALWAALDPEGQRLLVEEIRSAGIVAYCEWPTDGDSVRAAEVKP